MASAEALLGLEPLIGANGDEDQPPAGEVERRSGAEAGVAAKAESAVESAATVAQHSPRV